jgi:hypothetical protein
MYEKGGINSIRDLFDKDSVHDALLPGPAGNPRLPNSGFDYRPLGQDVSAHIVVVRIIFGNRFDAGLFDRAGPGVRHIRKLSAQDLDFRVPSECAGYFFPAIANCRIGWLTTNLKSPLRSREAVPATRLTSY